MSDVSLPFESVRRPLVSPHPDDHLAEAHSSGRRTRGFGRSSGRPVTGPGRPLMSRASRPHAGCRSPHGRDANSSTLCATPNQGRRRPVNARTEPAAPGGLPKQWKLRSVIAAFLLLVSTVNASAFDLVRTNATWRYFKGVSEASAPDRSEEHTSELQSH